MLHPLSSVQYRRRDRCSRRCRNHHPDRRALQARLVQRLLHVVVVVVFHVTIVASAHGVWKKLGPMAIGYVLHIAGSFFYLKRCTPAKKEKFIRQ